MEHAFTISFDCLHTPRFCTSHYEHHQWEGDIMAKLKEGGAAA
jgi:hypothetical protein